MNTLAEPVRAAIETWATELRDASALAVLTRNGEMTERGLAFYLTSLRYLLQHSQRNLKLASARSAELLLPELSRYFARKAGEEQGHDAWASEDLAQLPAAVVAGHAPSPWMVKLVELQQSSIRQHPMCFLVYCLWSEYFSVIVGDDWLDSLARCGFERTQVSALAKHMDADREHAAAGFAEIDRLWPGEPGLSELLAVVREASALFAAFADEVCGEARAA